MVATPGGSTTSERDQRPSDGADPTDAPSTYTVTTVPGSEVPATETSAEVLSNGFPATVGPSMTGAIGAWGDTPTTRLTAVEFPARSCTVRRSVAAPSASWRVSHLPRMPSTE